jgi:putative nucleotidyltransferase with HDIG domain
MQSTAQPVHEHSESGDLRLSELLTALSLVTDLGMGHPPEEAMRTCLLATALCRRLGCAETEVADAYWTALLMHVGCTAYAHEQAALFGGDEIAVNAVGSRTDFQEGREVFSFLLDVTKGMAVPRRAGVILAAAAAAPRFGDRVATATCEVAAGMARRLGLGAPVQGGMREMFERWDGRGSPRKLAGEAISRPARVAQLASQVTVFLRLGGLPAAVSMVRRRSGSALDPELADAFIDRSAELLKALDVTDPADTVLEAEPFPRRWVSDTHLDEVARAFADAIDLKSPFTLGHSAEVARLAEAAGERLSLGGAERAALRRAALFHDLGRAGVPNGIWEKPAALTEPEWERVRLHAYHSERILSRSDTLRPLAEIAGMHHERLDGSGYHRGASAPAQSMSVRVLAAADVFQAMTQRRAHREPLPLEGAAARLRTEVAAGRLDGDAVAAVLAAAGFASGARRTIRAGKLTDREVEVLRLLARGHTNKQMGRRLFISPKTVGRHVEHIYQKLEVSSRAAAAMYAAEHDLL